MRWLLKRKQGSVRICKAIKLAICKRQRRKRKTLTFYLGSSIIKLALFTRLYKYIKSICETGETREYREYGTDREY